MTPEEQEIYLFIFGLSLMILLAWIWRCYLIKKKYLQRPSLPANIERPGVPTLHGVFVVPSKIEAAQDLPPNYSEVVSNPQKYKAFKQ